MCSSTHNLTLHFGVDHGVGRVTWSLIHVTLPPIVQLVKGSGWLV